MFAPIALSLLLLGASASPPSAFETLPERARHGELGARLRAEAAARARAVRGGREPQRGATEVPLDWSAPDAHPRLRIRYHVDASAFAGAADARAPIFVAMGGEGHVVGRELLGGAREHGALCVAVEHRFYGESVPAAGAGGVGTPNLVAGLRVEFTRPTRPRSSTRCARSTRRRARPPRRRAASSRSAARTRARRARGSGRRTPTTRSAASRRPRS